MTNLYFDEKYHDYYYGGDRVPCVSDILAIVDSIAMKDIPRKYIEAAGELGTAVHEATERFEYGDYDLVRTIDELETDGDIDTINYIIAYQGFRQQHDSIPLAIEEQVYSEKYGIAGTIDRVMRIDGEMAIIDIKSAKTIKRLRNLIQLNLYRLIWNDTHEVKITGLYILQPTNTAEWRLIPLEINEEIALKYLAIYKEIKEDKAI